jgi:excisionase family DNA binding protein
MIHPAGDGVLTQLLRRHWIIGLFYFQAITRRVTMSQQFYSVAQAAKSLNVAKLTVYRRTATGEIPSIRVGRKILVPAAYIETLVARAMSGAQHAPAPESRGA